MQATEKQLKYIVTLARRVGKEVPQSRMEDLSKGEASRIIDRLQAKLGITSGDEIGNLRQQARMVDDALFGLSAKLVWQMRVIMKEPPLSNSFGEKVITLYQELSMLKQALKKEMAGKAQ